MNDFEKWIIQLNEQRQDRHDEYLRQAREAQERSIKEARANHEQSIKEAKEENRYYIRSMALWMLAWCTISLTIISFVVSN